MIMVKKFIKFKMEHFFSKLKNTCPCDDKIEIAKKGNKKIIFKNGEELSEKNLKKMLFN